MPHEGHIPDSRFPEEDANFFGLVLIGGGIIVLTSGFWLATLITNENYGTEED